jgi:hypothetical protein
LNKFQKYFKKITAQKASNIKVVVLCVLAATTFWILNALNKDNYTTVVDQPIEFYYDRQEYMAVEELPSKIRIVINGNGWDLLRKYFKFNVIPFPIELTDPSAQDYLLPNSFQRALAEQTAPTQLSDILEDTIKINIDKIIEDTLKVELDTSINPLGKNIRFASEIKIDPDSVTVRGPTSILERMEGKIILHLEDSNLNENFSRSLPLTVPTDYQRFLTLSEESVKVEFEVVQFLEGNKRLKIRKVNFPQNVTLTNNDTTIMMEYLVDEREMDALRELEIEAVLNYNNRNREDSTISPKLNKVPPFLDSIRFNPENFKLIYE